MTKEVIKEGEPSAPLKCRLPSTVMEIPEAQNISTANHKMAPSQPKMSLKGLENIQSQVQTEVTCPTKGEAQINFCKQWHHQHTYHTCDITCNIIIRSTISLFSLTLSAFKEGTVPLRYNIPLATSGILTCLVLASLHVLAPKFLSIQEGQYIPNIQTFLA